MFKINKTKSGYESEPLLSPFGFKGSYLSKLWQTVAYLENDNHKAIGLGVQSILWSDSSIFAEYGEDKGNELMFKITQYALGLIKGKSFETPIEMLDFLLPLCHQYGIEITGNKDLSKTFALNSLVAVDNAAWMLYAKENNITKFDNILPCKSGLSYKSKSLVNVPLITYNLSLDSIKKMADSGYCIFKIKIGSDPQKDGNLDEMLKWDKNRLFEIHNLLKAYKTPNTKSGNILYYLDANGRYDTKERLIELLVYLKEIDALDRVVLLEEPFEEENKIDVHDIPVCIAADESAHSDEEVIERIELGYKAITLKPIAKTLSMTIKIANKAAEKEVLCFCADLTVSPIMVDWNKNIAARLTPLDSMNTGIIESNGAQNYTNWNEMLKYHPLYGANFIENKNGIYELDSEFYEKSGGIFEIPQHYLDLVE